MDGTHPLTDFRNNHQPKLSQGDLARMLGVARETVTRWESRTRKINEQALPVVAEKTGIPAKDLRPDLAKHFEAAQ